MIECPNCHTEMSRPQVDDAQSLPAAIGACVNCNLFWFDDAIGIRLTPRDVMGLFRYVAASGTGGHAPLASAFTCPRCRHSLAFTNDLQRTTRFTYWRCVYDRGQLITFSQFLREKNFIRTPSPAELAKLRETIKQISCSQCGAPVDLATESACSHCGAPISMIDPDSIAKAVHELTTAADAEPTATATDATRTVLTNAQIDALFDQERIRESDDHPDLLAIGIGAVGAIIGGLLLSRE